MAKHPSSPRVPPKADEPDDKFIALIGRISIWAGSHSRALIIGAIVLGIVLIAGIYYIDSQRRVEAEASVRFTQVQQSVLTGNVPLAIRDLQTFIGTFGGTSAASEARILLADLLLAEGRPAEAIDAIGRLHRDLDSPAGIAAAQLLAAAYEALGNPDQALDVYRRIAAGARFDYERRDALANSARVALDAGLPDQAVRSFDQLVAALDEDDPDRGYWEMWRAEARARAAAGPAPAAAETPATDAPADTDG